MGDLISIFEFVIQHNEYLVLLILTLLLLLAFVILLAEYKTKVIYYILHRRNKWWFAFDISSVIVLFVIVKYMNIPLWLTIVLTVLWAILFIYSCIRIRPMKESINPIILFYRRKIKNGYAFEYANYFKKQRHWYFISLSSRIEYSKLRAAYYLELEDYEIYKYKNLMLYKLSILKFFEKEKHIDKSKELYISLYKTLLQAGCKIDAVNVLMILLDECTSPYNMLIEGPFGRTYYYHFIQKTYPSIEPEIAADGIHIKIQDYNLKIPFNLILLKNDVINEYISIAVKEVSIWFNHPAKYEMSIKLCRILLGLNRIEEARKMYLIFKESKRSIDSYALWFQLEIQDIESFFKNK